MRERERQGEKKGEETQGAERKMCGEGWRSWEMLSIWEGRDLTLTSVAAS